MAISKDRQDEYLRRADIPLTVVEFFGTPGAGKSTLAKALAARVPAQTRHQLSAEWHRQSALTKATYIAKGFANATRLIGAARLVLGCRLRGHASIARLFRVIAKSEWLRSQHGFVLLDQGFLQDLWSVLFMGRCNSPKPTDLSVFLRSVFPPASTRIVFVRVDPELAFRRITSRPNGHSRLDSLPHAELQSSIAGSAQLPGAIINGARAAGLEVLTLDGSEEVQVLADRLLSVVSADTCAAFTQP